MVLIRDVASIRVRATAGAVAAALGGSATGGAKVRIDDAPGSFWLVEPAPGGAKLLRGRAVRGDLKLRLEPRRIREETLADLERVRKLVEVAP